MALTESTMLPLGTQAPDFELPDAHGNMVSLKGLSGGPALLVAFICNHCPYVKQIKPALAALVQEFQPRGLAAVAINSNDYSAYPADSPERMADDVATFGYTFPYLVDEDQSVAHAYHAACTPEFYLFDGDGKLAYRGRFDGSSPGRDEAVSGGDLQAALEAVLSGSPVASDQIPSVGCNIKWKPGRAPDYLG